MVRMIAFACVLVGVAVVPRVHAQDAAEARDDEARLRFEIARRAHADGRYEEAYENYARAHELSGRHALLFNMGNVAERLRRDDDAIAAYRRYLDAIPDAHNRPEVERRIDILQRAIDEREEGGEAPDVRPETVAAQSVAAPAPVETEAQEGGVATKWWFWTIVGVVVVGAGVGVGLALSGGGTADPPSGFGPIIQAQQAR